MASPTLKADGIRKEAKPWIRVPSAGMRLFGRDDSRHTVLSFPYTELAEYGVQDIFGTGFTGDLAETMQGFAQFKSQEFCREFVVFEAFCYRTDVAGDLLEYISVADGRDEERIFPPCF